MSGLQLGTPVGGISSSISISSNLECPEYPGGPPRSGPKGPVGGPLAPKVPCGSGGPDPLPTPCAGPVEDNASCFPSTPELTTMLLLLLELLKTTVQQLGGDLQSGITWEMICLPRNKLHLRVAAVDHSSLWDVVIVQHLGIKHKHGSL
eukprot:3305096-Ditylum_brightwellii.AAC.1